jgi:hypothetical protein
LTYKLPGISHNIFIGGAGPSTDMVPNYSECYLSIALSKNKAN